MSTVEQTLIVAQLNLKAAEAEAAKDRRENAKQEIKRLRCEGAELLAQLRPLVAQVAQAQQDRLKLNGLLISARNNIAAYSQPLDPLTFPSDEESAAHAQQLVLWRERQKELLRQNEDACQREAVRLQAVALKDRLEHLQHAIQNLTAVAEGRKPGELEGGVYAGVEDFIGNTQMPPH